MAKYVPSEFLFCLINLQSIFPKFADLFKMFVGNRVMTFCSFSSDWPEMIVNICWGFFIIIFFAYCFIRNFTVALQGFLEWVIHALFQSF